MSEAARTKIRWGSTGAAPAGCVAAFSGLADLSFCNRQGKEIAMKSTVGFTGMDEHDIERQLWDWRSAHPTARNLHRHSFEHLPLSMKATERGAKLDAQAQISLRVDYEE
jgi:hypothetical protein